MQASSVIISRRGRRKFKLRIRTQVRSIEFVHPLVYASFLKDPLDSRYANYNIGSRGVLCFLIFELDL